MKIVHVITGLGAGGAESMLLKLLSAQQETARSGCVVSLTGVGPVGEKIQALGVPVIALGMRRGRPDPAALVALIRILRRVRPDLVQTWMYHADLLGGLAARAAGVPVVWGVRHGPSARGDKLLTRLARQACAWTSRWIPAAVVCNSNQSRRVHAACGYAANKLVVVPNGFDVTRFRPDPAARASVRTELGVARDAALVGLVARYHPHKDHATFLAAAARIRAEREDVCFVLCGEGVDGSNAELAAILDRLDLREAARLLGRRDDIERILASLDVACVSSTTESFPNVVGEAMACGVPCVSTDCGDVAEIVGDTGVIVPVGDPGAFAAAVVSLLRLDPAERAALGAAARSRVAEEFALPVVARKFAAIQHEAARTCAA
jgi:glycosyltransferase involved in cell wall biosynthesis